MTSLGIISIVLLAVALFASGWLWAHSVQMAKAKAARDKLVKEACMIVTQDMAKPFDPKTSHCVPEPSLAFKFLLTEQMREAFKHPTAPPENFVARKPQTEGVPEGYAAEGDVEVVRMTFENSPELKQQWESWHDQQGPK